MEELKEGIIINNRYLLKEFKGSGSFGEVWLAKDNLLGIDVALKIYIAVNQSGLEEFKKEYLAAHRLSHSNLLVPMHYDVWNNKPFLELEYCSEGSVGNKAGKIQEKDLWRFIRDVAAGLKYLHTLPNPVIHQDIKPDNVLIDDNGIYRITDFGVCKQMKLAQQRATQKRTEINHHQISGAQAYMGPEKFKTGYNPVMASDIWALGVSIYELATGELPFNGFGGMAQLTNNLPSLPSNWSIDLNKLMQKCLALETWDRLTAAQIEEISGRKIEGKKVVWSKYGIDNNDGKETTESPGPSGSPKPKGWQDRIKKFTKPFYKSYKSNRVIWIIGLLCICGISLWIGLYYYNSNQTALSTPEVIPVPNPVETEKTDENPGVKDITDKTDTHIERVERGTSTDKEQGVLFPPPSSVTRRSYDFGYATYSGEMKNGKPDGKGKMTFTSSHTDNKRGYSAESGDFIEGFFTNGNLDQGALYKSDGTKVKVIY